MKNKAKKLLLIALSVCLVLSLGARPETALAEKYKKGEDSRGYLLAKKYDYSKSVPKSEAKGANYWSEAAVFGDSRTEGLFLYTDLSKTKAKKYCDIGLNCQTALTKKIIKVSGKKVKALTHLESNKKSVKRVYFLFGLNELSWNTDTFISNYKKLISEVRAIVPEAEIYLQSIIPVTKSKDKTDKTHNNSRIKAFNAALKIMCEEEKIFFVDAYSVMTDGEGNLPEAISSDGIHFDSKFTEKWLDFLCKRTVEFK